MSSLNEWQLESYSDWSLIRWISSLRGIYSPRSQIKRTIDLFPSRREGRVRASKGNVGRGYPQKSKTFEDVEGLVPRRVAPLIKKGRENQSEYPQ